MNSCICEQEDSRSPDANAATVNGQAVPEADVQRILSRIPKERQKEGRAEVIEILVDNMLLDQFLHRLKFNVDPKQVDQKIQEIKDELKKSGKEFGTMLREMSLSEADLRAHIAADLRWKAFLGERVKEDALKDLLAKEPELFDGSQVRASHILLSPPGGNAEACDQAQSTLKRVKADIEKKVSQGLANLPKDVDDQTRERERHKIIKEAFAAAAKEVSVCPSKKDGGDLNFLPREGYMAEPFAKAAFGLKPFEMSDVIKTQYGFHLILVTDRKAGTPVKFEDVRDQIKDVYGERLRTEIISHERLAAKIGITPQK
jgi:parvulin-like peptidyl-prolyl isomerase